MATHSETATVDSETAAIAISMDDSSAAASLPPTIHSFSSANETHSTTPSEPTTQDSSLSFLRPVHPEQQRDPSQTKYMKLIEDFNAALSKACVAGKALQDCRTEEKQKGSDVCSLEEDGFCLEERKEYEEKCEKLLKYEKHLKEAYENDYKELKEALKEVEKQLLTNEKDHKDRIEAIEQKHNTELKELAENLSLHADLQVLQSEASVAARLKELKQSYQEKQEEVQSLRTKLAEKEKVLYQLGGQIQVLENEVKRQLMIIDKEHMEQQLQTCTQIEGLVSRLPCVDGDEIESVVKEIAAAIEEMKGKTGSKRAVSWRR